MPDPVFISVLRTAVLVAVAVGGVFVLGNNVALGAGYRSVRSARVIRGAPVMGPAVSVLLALVLGAGVAQVLPGVHGVIAEDGRGAVAAARAEADELWSELEAIRASGVSPEAVDEHRRLRVIPRVAAVQVEAERAVALAFAAERVAVLVACSVLVGGAVLRLGFRASLPSLAVALMLAIDGGSLVGGAVAGVAGVSQLVRLAGLRAGPGVLAWVVPASVGVLASVIAFRAGGFGAAALGVVAVGGLVAGARLRARAVMPSRVLWSLPIAAMGAGWLRAGGPEMNAIGAHTGTASAAAAALVLVGAVGLATGCRFGAPAAGVTRR